MDRAAAAGILWFNSAGNYAQRHWSGEWTDADADADLDWPNGDAWSFERGAGLPITFALSWTSPPGGPATDIDLILERQDPAGTWTPAIGSSDRQSAGAPPAERIVGYTSPVGGVFRLRAVLGSGPPPEGPLTLFSREIAVTDIGGTAVSSTPTPGDAAGAVAVGAVDWRGDRFKGYSSQGPSDDGRLKPDLVAPTDTRLMGPNGLRSVGGTSIAAPNAAGAAAVLLAAERRAGRFPSAGEIRGQLGALAVNLGTPGPDAIFGAGRVRVSIDAPRMAALEPAPFSSIRGKVTVRFKALSRSKVTQWALRLDGTPAVRRAQTYPRGIGVDTRRLPDGWHALAIQAKDFPGNVGLREWAVKVDNTRPRLVVRSVRLVRARRALSEPGPRRARLGARRPMRMVVAVADAGTTGALTARIELRTASGRFVSLRSAKVKPGPLRTIALGRLARGRYRARIICATGPVTPRPRRGRSGSAEGGAPAPAPASAAQPPALAEPAGHRPPRRRHRRPGPGALAQLGDHPARRSPAAKRRSASRRSSGQAYEPGRARAGGSASRARCASRARRAPRHAPRRLPRPHQARREVPPRPPRQELRAPMGRAEPHRHPAGKVQRPRSPCPGPMQIRHGGRFPSRSPL